MARPVTFDGANLILKAPLGQEETCGELPVFRNGLSCTSCWQLSEQEIESVVNTGRIFLTVFAGSSQPPVFVGTEEQSRQLVAESAPAWEKNENGKH